LTKKGLTKEKRGSSGLFPNPQMGGEGGETG